MATLKIIQELQADNESSSYEFNLLDSLLELSDIKSRDLPQAIRNKQSNTNNVVQLRTRQNTTELGQLQQLFALQQQMQDETEKGDSKTEELKLIKSLWEDNDPTPTPPATPTPF